MNSTLGSVVPLAIFLLGLALGGQGLTLAPCFKGEGEGGADGEGEVEGQALAS